jgi:D-psicose/D-tagatose/L-ribulose 3-epimerase
MNKIGIYYAYWTHNWDADFNEYVLKAASLGFDILQVNSGTVTNMSNSERDKLRKTAEKAKIYDISSPDSVVRKKGIDFLKRQAQMLKYMNGESVGGIIYSTWPGNPPEGMVDKRPYLKRSVESMKEAIKTAEDCGVCFDIEVVNRFEQYLINTCDEAIEYVNMVASPNCRVMLDMFHMNIEEDSMSEPIIKAGKRLGQFHIGETNRRAPGRGRMPWDEVFGALKKINYKGSIVMEPFLMPGGEVGRDIRVFRDLRDGLDIDLEAKRACEFVRMKLQNA